MREIPPVRHLTAHVLVLITIMCNSITAEPDHSEIHFTRGAAAHIVASPESPLEQRVADRLGTYLERVLGAPPVIAKRLRDVPKGRPAIVLANGKVTAPWAMDVSGSDDECYALSTGGHQGRQVVVAAGKTDRGLKRAVQQLVFRSRQEPDALVIPALALSESPWIPAREWTACPWSPSFIRGVFHNPNADLRLDVFRYNDERLASYVEMFDWFGYSGCQLMETCYTYAVFGTIEDAQNWQKRAIRYLRENGQEVSLWAWAANFNGHGWVDPEVVYTPKNGASAYDDPDVRRTFEKYYDHYAKLAPHIDRFFAHFFDPGELKDNKDVFKYMHLLEGKLKAGNPDIQMGIDGWAADPNYVLELAENGFKDYLMLEISFPELYKDDARRNLHKRARDMEMNLGIWGWYATEYETDQLASMYVNANLLSEMVQQIKTEGHDIHPVTYWSEMEAHHLNNIYSMYAAAQLQWNPNRDPHELLVEIADAVWGPRNAPVIVDALELIQDMRSGDSWKTYWWTKKTHRVGSEDAAADLKRANAVLAAIDGMALDEAFVPKVPLPYPPETFIELMRPHLLQIIAYAEFRVGVSQLRKAAADGAAQDALQAMLDEVWKPVPEYNTWIGVFGTKELREQKRIVREIAGEYGLVVNDPAWLRELEADRVFQQLKTWQRTSRAPYIFDAVVPTREFFWPEDNRADRFNLLVERGLVVDNGDGRFRLKDWENWRLRP